MRKTVVVALLLFCSVAYADVLQLKNGRVLKGKCVEYPTPTVTDTFTPRPSPTITPQEDQKVQVLGIISEVRCGSSIFVKLKDVEVFKVY